ncbi:hypothetical protein [Halobacillus seohaensis]|uniref:Uncharacterized protein n=1 Tax=Halobacillus seohaensis TaxID=447421 RepID=A0ABW2ENG4_9BACI
MKKQNQMFIILSFVGIANIITAIILFFSVQDPMVSGMLILSGALLILGGWVDRKERIKKKRD